jgi:hydrogenase maturation protein HypF
MARDIEVIQKYCTPNSKELELLQSSAAPIVLMLGRNEIESSHTPLSDSIAPGQNTLGFMLPYTPLHHLILKRMNRPIVLTSGNIADEPQCIDNQEAREKLGKIADYFLFHNRDIVNRVDDSIVRVVGDKIQTIRRARGYAPAPIKLPPGFEKSPQVLAMGGELKNTICLLRNGKAVLSQHLGNLENATTFQAYEDTLNLYLSLFEHKPQLIAIDKHPEYLSSKLGKQLAAANNLQLTEIQHHHAHIAACMAENGISINAPPVLGIAFDGLGYGEDNTLWGGEFLLADYRQFQRLAAFKPVAMIGGKQAIYQPWRNTYAHLLPIWSQLKQKYNDLELISFLEEKPLNLFNQLLEKQLNSPLSSSVGRLFDAVAAAIGICWEGCSYEGQAAIEMEGLIDCDEQIESYNFAIIQSDNIDYIDSQPMWFELLDDLQQIPKSVIAAKFHNGLVSIVIKMVKHLQQTYRFNQVVLTGGVFQNSILFEQVKSQLNQLEVNVLSHSVVPCNDGGISLGQAVIAAANQVTQDA